MLVLPNTKIIDQGKFVEYCKLIDDNRKNKQRRFYTEKHHIIPKCLGGSDSKNNLINLPYNLHYRAHFLLSRCTDSYSLFHAFMYMSKNEFITEINDELENDYVVRRTMYLIRNLAA